MWKCFLKFNTLTDKIGKFRTEYFQAVRWCIPKFRYFTMGPVFEHFSGKTNKLAVENNFILQQSVKYYLRNS